MLALEDLPPLSTPATIALVGLVVLLWIGMRVNILRRTMDLPAADGRPIQGPAWLRSLAAWRGTYPALGVAAVGLVALLFV